MDATPPSSSPSLDQLASPQVAVVQKESEISALRRQMIRDAACSLGARGGLAARSAEVRREVDQHAASLDRRYAFQSLLLANGLLPAVVTEVRDAVKQDAPNILRYAGAIYRIESPERFVTGAPTWRDYLYRGFPGSGSAVTMPDSTFLPKTDAEKDFWKRTVVECWASGEEQAMGIFDANLSRLDRDFAGMLRYKLLVLKGMVAEPRVAVDSRAASGSGAELVVDDQVFTVSRPTGFQRDAIKWK